MFKKQKIYNIFYILLLKQNIIKKKEVNKIKQDFKFKADNNKEYKIKGI